MEEPNEEQWEKTLLSLESARVMSFGKQNSKVFLECAVLVGLLC